MLNEPGTPWLHFYDHRRMVCCILPVIAASDQVVIRDARGYYGAGYGRANYGRTGYERATYGRADYGHNNNGRGNYVQGNYGGGRVAERREDGNRGRVVERNESRSYELRQKRSWKKQ